MTQTERRRFFASLAEQCRLLYAAPVDAFADTAMRGFPAVSDWETLVVARLGRLEDRFAAAGLTMDPNVSSPSSTCWCSPDIDGAEETFTSAYGIQTVPLHADHRALGLGLEVVWSIAVFAQSGGRAMQTGCMPS
jgi:hypothetical protein